MKLAARTSCSNRICQLERVTHSLSDASVTVHCHITELCTCLIIKSLLLPCSKQRAAGQRQHLNQKGEVSFPTYISRKQWFSHLQAKGEATWPQQIAPVWRRDHVAGNKSGPRDIALLSSNAVGSSKPTNLPELVQRPWFLSGLSGRKKDPLTLPLLWDRLWTGKQAQEGWVSITWIFNI